MKHIITLLLLFPLFIFSQVQIGQDIIGEAENDGSGWPVSLSADGSVVAIGAIANDGNGSRSGHVRVFENQSGSWVQIGQDIDGEALDDFSGYSVSLSADGSVVAIGAPNNDENGIDSGHVRVYKNQSGVWTQIGSDIDGEGGANSEGDIGSEFGSFVSLSGDGTVLAISARAQLLNQINRSGYVQVYKNISGVWTQIGSTIDTEPEDTFLTSVVLSDDGTTIGIRFVIYNGSEQFSFIRIYKNQSGIWTQTGQDINGYYLCSLSSDGNKIAVGKEEYISGEHTIIVKVYENQSETWTQVSSDIEWLVSNSDNDIINPRIDLSNNGDIIAISYINHGSNTGFGQTRIYLNQSNEWTQIGSDIIGETENDFFGDSISLNADGSKIAIGASGTYNDISHIGYVRVYDLTQALSVDENSLINFNLFPNPASTSIAIEVPKNLDIKTIAIYNNLGQLVTKTTKSIVDVSSLSSGVYVVEVITNKGKASKKLIIE
ncbi:T9SS type A sorting domain-containing protein [Hanstruepera ponticola]|uniref:T9SS type A sorting domain-containing protein n=1 Tax=Hanstruepera ponticola TaxID=2042995 RepID=UPI001786BC5B|nr:T9SS type A sorting domain-containing protein [Hanstruepera ponticola]